MFSYSFPHKICDSIHGFIRFDPLEKDVIDSRPFQRLRYLHQMGPAYLVYPGATHRRFEHSLGVMELATRIYDTLMAPHTFKPENIKPVLPSSSEELFYWRRILRLAALCHDMGHLPFSHTAEKELLPDGGHEYQTIKFIQSHELKPIWQRLGSKAEEDILKLAVQEKELLEFGTGLTLTSWERILSRIITEDNFGADRIDYLIRDARHTGVGYGHFDYHQLIDTLRILSYPHQESILTIGVAESGIQSVESLWIARYLMYARVYHHPKVRLFSHHLRRFMVAHYKKYHFPKALEDYLQETDVQILAALAKETLSRNFDALVLMKQQDPFKELAIDHYSKSVLAMATESLIKDFGDSIIIDSVKGGRGSDEQRRFPVLKENGKVVSSVEVSQFLRDIPLGGKSLRIYSEPRKSLDVQRWLDQHVASKLSDVD